jgi:protoporphyrinogen oxidase
MKIGILGAGISGLSSALLLQSQGHQVSVFEKEGRPGGLARTRKIDGYYFDIGGGHIFNAKSKVVKDWVFDILPVEKWKYNLRKAKISYQGKLLDYPFELALGQLSPEQTSDCIVDLFNARQGKEPANFHDWLIWQFGTSIAREYLIPYNQKMWGYDLREISTDWIRGKLPTPDIKAIVYAALSKDPRETEMVHSSFYYPYQGGIQAFVDAMSEKLQDLRLKVPVLSLEKINSDWVINGEFRCDKVISTISLPELAKVYSFPTVIKDIIDRLKYKSTTIALFDARVDPDISWIYFAGPERYNKLSYVSNFSDSSSPMILADISGKATEDELRSLKVGRLIDYHYNQYAYPIFYKDYKDSLNKIFKYISENDLVLLGRFAEWKYYNMDKCIERVFQYVQGAEYVYQ